MDVELNSLESLGDHVRSPEVGIWSETEGEHLGVSALGHAADPWVVAVQDREAALWQRFGEQTLDSFGVRERTETLEVCWTNVGDDPYICTGRGDEQLHLLLRVGSDFDYCPLIGWMDAEQGNGQADVSVEVARRLMGSEPV